MGSGISDIDEPAVVQAAAAVDATLSATVVAIREGSPAAQSGVLVGDRILRINGVVPRDIIEWTMLLDDADPSVDLLRGQEVLEIDIAKGAGEPFGADVQSAVFDRVQTCDNHCPFCFIYQLPPGLRRSLYLKDDDYRLSFLYGNFTTLTRFTELDLERVVTERLSPLHVSIHATDPAVRSEMLRNRRGGVSLRWVRSLLRAGIAIRAQIVVCPGVNDADVLDETLGGLLDRFDGIDAIAVVPLGISQFNGEETMRAHEANEAEHVLEIVERWQERFRRATGRAVVYAADEYYIMAGRPFPEPSSYGDFDLHEDGIGMAAAFALEFRGEVDRAIGPQAGFFAAVDLPENPASYTALRRTGCESDALSVQPVSLRRQRTETADRPESTVVLTGTLGAAVLEPLIASLRRTDVRVVPVPNRFFGGTTGVTGLLTGTDIAAALETEPIADRYLLPDVCLSEDGRFLDGSGLEDLPRPVEVVATNGIALRKALEREWSQ
jgi:putative radical SAM enzyme (TIGR03279 family)